MDDCKALLAELSGRLEDCPSRSPQSEYNLFDVLSVGENEVIMCRFLADLLNPEGRHNCGDLFLKSFLQSTLPECPMSDALLAHTSVFTEYRLENRRRIDIVIQNSQYFIPIEVKVNYIDGNAQCWDYYQYARNAPIIYLTKSGTPPSEDSRRQPDGSALLPLDCIRCISWSVDIVPWLTGLLPELEGLIKSLVEQYISTIRITDERGRDRIEQCVQAALTSPAFFQAGLDMEQLQPMKSAKVTLMRLMFDCFKEEMEPTAARYGLELETDTQYFFYKHPHHDTYYDLGPDDSTCPGLNYIVKNANFLNKNLQMWFRIEVWENLYAGFSLFDPTAESKYEYYQGCELDQISPELVEESAQYIDRDILTLAGWWLTWCYPNGMWQEYDYPDVPNFKTMNPCAVSLVDPQERLRYVRNAIKVFERELLEHLL